ncbi:MAG: MliC family protein [Prevotellaceae bacterium]|jgi:membrane-bound inhibitor of C-type lysozyme|nr:MliC family protein [Prevotellaceae bacterium]
MKKEILLIVTVAGAFLVSCGGNNSSKQQNSDKLDNIATLIDNLAQSAVVDSAGSILEMSFNEENNTAFFVFNGEIIEMQRDTVASGIRYSNPHYVYTEWHGEMTLEKDGKEVFRHRNPSYEMN